jgi:hypothetical protein
MTEAHITLYMNFLGALLMTAFVVFGILSLVMLARVMINDLWRSKK